jgi:hypothetical protein
MIHSGEQNVPGAGGNLGGLIAGGTPLKNVFPGASWDMPLRPVPQGAKIPLKNIFPPKPGTYPGDPTPFGAKIPPGDLSGNPFGQQFVIQQRGIRGMTPGQLEELKQWDPGSSQQLQNIYNNKKPGGPQLLPLAYSNGFSPTRNMGEIAMGNAGVDAKALADFQSLLDQDMEARPWNNQRQQPQIPAGFVMSGLY